MSFLRVNRKMRCPLCRKADWCMVSADGTRALCNRVESTTPAPKSGGWLHRLDDSDARARAARFARTARSKSDNSPNERAPLEKRHRVYRAFLQSLALLPKHARLLEARGLLFEQIVRFGFRSVPAETRFNRESAFLRETDCAGVPGFYRKNGSWQFCGFRGATGFLIPIRNHNGLIEALSIRRDDHRAPKYLFVSSAKLEAGASSGAPAHFAFPNRDFDSQAAREIIVTEGALKAMICSVYAEAAVVGLGSTTCFDESLPDTLRRAFPRLQKILVAYDCETRPQVIKHVEPQKQRLINLLTHAGFQVSSLSWNPAFKGLDDFLVHRHRQDQFVAADFAA